MLILRKQSILQLSKCLPQNYKEYAAISAKSEILVGPEEFDDLRRVSPMFSGLTILVLIAFSNDHLH
jgi:hypothetical protein